MNPNFDMNRFMSFANNFMTGMSQGMNPQQFTQQLLNSGKVNQQTFNQAWNDANNIMQRFFPGRR